MKSRCSRPCKEDERFTICDSRFSALTHHATVKRHLAITTEPIDEPALLAGRTLSSGMGAVVYFLGVVRDLEGDTTIRAIDYEAFEPMARHQFELIFAEIKRRWSIESIRLVHRIGGVNVGEPSLWVEVVAPHRGEAFAACLFLIEEMKRVVPIWKKPIATGRN